MSEIGVIILLYAVGLAMLIAEIFIPSHGILTVAGLGLLIWGVVETFLVGGQTAGVISVLTCLVLLPTLAYGAIKVWPRTPLGRRIAPPNPTVTLADTSVPAAELSRLIGVRGRTLSPLRPVGLCEFNGRRVSCIAELGMLESGVEVVATRVAGANVVVRSAEDQLNPAAADAGLT